MGFDFHVNRDEAARHGLSRSASALRMDGSKPMLL